jgi:hypothetical protein
MTINGPAATLCAFFMNAAIDQQCELYIKEHGLEAKVEAKKKELYDDKGLERPSYKGAIPENNDQLGLMLLGLTGDMILNTLFKIRFRTSIPFLFQGITLQRQVPTQSRSWPLP